MNKSICKELLAKEKWKLTMCAMCKWFKKRETDPHCIDTRGQGKDEEQTPRGMCWRQM